MSAHALIAELPTAFAEQLDTLKRQIAGSLMTVDLDYADREVRAGRAVAFFYEGRFVVSAYARNDEHVIALRAQDKPKAQEIEARAQRMIAKVERDCATSRMVLGDGGRIIGTADISPNWVAFAQRLLDDEDYVGRVRFALRQGQEARDLERFRREKEAAEERRKARLAASGNALLPPAQPPAPPRVTEQSGKERPKRADGKVARSERDFARDYDISPAAD